MRRAAVVLVATAACAHPAHHAAPAPAAIDDGLRHAMAEASRNRVVPTTSPGVAAAPHRRRVPPPAVRPPASPTCGRWTALLAAYPWPVHQACRVMMCESHGNPSARNPHSSARGLFQILGGSLDPAANVRHAFAMWSRSGWRPWVCRP